MAQDRCESTSGIVLYVQYGTGFNLKVCTVHNGLVPLIIRQIYIIVIYRQRGIFSCKPYRIISSYDDNVIGPGRS